MSKTTPEEAKALAEKHGFVVFGHEYHGLAALIDEARGVDAEPVGYICPARLKNLQAGRELSIPMVHKSEALLGGGTGYLQDIPVYTHPAPSQPAARMQSGESNAYALLANILQAYEGIPINMRTAGDSGIPFEPGVAKALAVLQEGLREFASQQTEPAAPVELPVVGYASPNNLYRSRLIGISNGEQLLEPLVKLSDAQAAIAAGNK